LVTAFVSPYTESKYRIVKKQQRKNSKKQNDIVFIPVMVKKGSVQTVDNESLKGQVAIVTDSARGIGKAIALKLAKAERMYSLAERMRNEREELQKSFKKK